MAEFTELKFVQRDGRENIKDIDKTVKNKFNWSWLDEKDHLGEFMSEYIRKLFESGMAWCSSCMVKINYGSSGKKALISHSKKVDHGKSRRAKKLTQELPAAMKATRSLEDCSTSSGQPTVALPYGTSQCMRNFLMKAMPKPTTQEPQPPPQPIPVSLADRKSHQEGLICTFIAEHDLPLSLAPHIIALAQELSKDPKALNSVSMERTSATYKLKHGVHLVNRKRLVNIMQVNTFSLNIDESTTKSSRKRVMNVLVCFFSDELKESITEHYCSLEMSVVNAQTVYEAIRNQLQSDGIPFSNLVSMLTDSAAYMRGCHNGFQEKMKADAPHLIDIDGDVCHHVHNIVKNFVQEMDPANFLPSFLDDLFRDFSLSADLREDLAKISECLGLPMLVPLERIGHRWLSLYDTTLRFTDILDQLTAFYYAWLSQTEKELYKEEFSKILSTTTASKRSQIYATLKRLKGKNLTKPGMDRKKRIVSKLFYKRQELLLLSNVTISILPMFKSFVLKFEQKEPMVHKLHDSMKDTFKSFLASFMKIECISGKLHDLDVSSKEKHLPLKRIFIGSKANTIVSEMRQEDSNKFLSTLQKAYISTAGYMKKKLPLKNQFLKCLSALDPVVRGHSVAQSAMLDLVSFFPNVCLPSEKDVFFDEVKSFHLAKDLPPHDNIRLDHWWAQVMPHFKTLAPVVKACLSIFTGPKVEQSFSMMNNIINSKTNRLAISTYAAYQSVKYHLLARKTTAVQLFRRQDILYDPVDKPLVFHVQTAKQRSLKVTPSTNQVKSTAAPTAHERSDKQVEDIHANNPQYSLSGAPPSKRLKD